MDSFKRKKNVVNVEKTLTKPKQRKEPHSTQKTKREVLRARVDEKLNKLKDSLKSSAKRINCKLSLEEPRIA